jgi:transcription termination factor Rho
VSVDASQLEGKGREELATIASALGGKPTSRAKKSEIVDMILELSGNTTGSSGGTSQSDAGSSDAGDQGGQGGQNNGGGRGRSRSGAAGRSNGDTAAADADSDSGDQAPAPADASGSGETGTSESGDDKAEGGDEPSRGDRGDRNGGQGGDRSQGGGQNNGGRNQGGQNNGGRNGGQGNRQGGQGGQGNRQGGQGGQGGQDDGDEGNRRRRRRRGRDRDRPEEFVDQPFDGEPVPVMGLLDLHDQGYGFLRVQGFKASRDDVYVSVKQTRQLGLRKGDVLEGMARPAGRQEKNPALLQIDKVNGLDPEKAKERPRFEDLTPLFPDEKLSLERADLPGDMTARIIDLIAPIGKGQRGLIVSPPKAGKTTVMKTIAQCIEHNNPEVHLIVLLVDERPEEVTDMRRSVRGDVVASTFDRPSDEHTQVAELTIERAKRLVEDGKDVVIILDGITRLARAYNLAAPATGRIMSGGIDTGALYPPKRFFGAARNVEEGGSLTILATALVETGSKMDEVIFEEFKGTGNMEIRLDRKAAEKRVYPAIDVDASSTRHEELLFERDQLQQVWRLRRVLGGLHADGGNPGAGLELLIDRMKTFPNNDVFLKEISKASASMPNA